MKQIANVNTQMQEQRKRKKKPTNPVCIHMIPDIISSLRHTNNFTHTASQMNICMRTLRNACYKFPELKVVWLEILASKKRIRDIQKMERNARLDVEYKELPVVYKKRKQQKETGWG
jgi:hypothetical protein